MKLWNSHPRVFLEIAHQGHASCPYCGTEYRLEGRVRWSRADIEPGRLESRRSLAGVSAAHTNELARSVRVLHFVTGGFSGATQVAVDLCPGRAGRARHADAAGAAGASATPRTRASRRCAIRAAGAGRIQLAACLHGGELRRIIRDWRPDVVFAHGFSDHIWGRRAAVAEHVPRIFHVEHNSRASATRRGGCARRWR